MTTRAYSQRHLISVAELASAIAIARGTTGVDELRELARQAEDGNLAALPLYPPHQLWQHGGDVNRIGVPTENPAAIWRLLAAKLRKPHMSDKDAFNYPPAASTWHMLAADVYGLGKNHALNRRAAAALRELAIRYSPELGDDETKPAPAAPPEAVLMPAQAAPDDGTRPVQRQYAQEQAIMRLIREAGHDPLHLPMNEPGKPGIKSHVRKLVMRDPLFTGANVFGKAWDRLRSSGEIADQH